jgi:arylsulfatase A-like enzyme
MFIVPLLLAGCALFDPPPRRNVLVVVWDTARADRMSLYGHDRPTTPLLDARAETARVYERAWSPSSWTVPSHASFFTGLAPRAHRANGETRWLAPEHLTLAEELGAAGYATYLFTANPNLVTANLHQGFQTVVTPADHREEVAAWNRAKLHPEDASSHASPASRVHRPSAHMNDVGPLPARLLGEWVATHDEPWFAVVNYMEVHYPRLPTAAAREAVIPAKLQAAALQVRNDAAIRRRLNAGTFGYSPGMQQSLRAVYDATMWDLDRATEALFDALDAQGALDDTWVVLVSDHGEQFGRHGTYGHAHDLYEPLVHVPLVVWGPGVRAARVAEPVSTIGIHGLVRHAAGLERRPAVLLEPGGEVVVERTTRYTGEPEEVWAIRGGDHKLLQRADGDAQLFDLVEDPTEEDDRASREPRVVRDLQRRLSAWRATWPPPLETTSRRGTLSQELADELRALGYAE